MNVDAEQKLLDRWGFPLPGLSEEDLEELGRRRESYRRRPNPWMTPIDQLLPELIGQEQTAADLGAVVKGSLKALP